MTRPPLLRQLTETVRLPADVIEEAFLADNPDLSADQITITCKAGAIQEARVCLTKDLEPRACTGSVARACTMTNATFAPVR